MNEDNTGISSGIENPAVAAQASWWRIADFGVLGLWIVTVGFTIQYHEKWADEAQAWLIARDLDLRTLWFHELRYEGSPGLWHTILWVAQRVFHAKYGAISYLGWPSRRRVWFCPLRLPFPRPLRWMMALSYVLVYQYAVIARPLQVVPVLWLLLPGNSCSRLGLPNYSRLRWFCWPTSAHGTLMAGCLGVAFRSTGSNLVSSRRAKCGNGTCCARRHGLTFLFLFLILFPAADIEATHKKDP